jgi:hypothetical protein
MLVQPEVPQRPEQKKYAKTQWNEQERFRLKVQSHFDPRFRFGGRRWKFAESASTESLAGLEEMAGRKESV